MTGGRLKISNLLPSNQGIIWEYLADYWAYLRMAAKLVGNCNLPAKSMNDLVQEDVGQRIIELGYAAEGLLKKNETTTMRIFESACLIFQRFTSVPGLYPLTITGPPPHPRLYVTGITLLALEAMMWAKDDRLLTIKEASKESGISINILKRRANHGQIHCYIKPDESNPNERKLVILSEIRKIVNDNKYT